MINRKSASNEIESQIDSKNQEKVESSAQSNSISKFEVFPNIKVKINNVNKGMNNDNNE